MLNKMTVNNNDIVSLYKVPIHVVHTGFRMRNESEGDGEGFCYNKLIAKATGTTVVTG